MDSGTMTELGISLETVEVVDGSGSCPQLELKLTETAGGQLVVRPDTRQEAVLLTIETVHLQLQLGRPAADVPRGALIMPYGTIEGERFVLQTVALGHGLLVLTETRAIGLVSETSHAVTSLGEPIRFVEVPSAAIDDEGNGKVCVFTVERRGLNDLELRKKALGGGLKAATLSGVCVITVEPTRVLGRHGAFRVPERKEMEKALREFVDAQL